MAFVRSCRQVAISALLVSAALLQTSCGGGSSDDSGRSAPTYTIGGTILGLDEGFLDVGNGLDVVRISADPNTPGSEIAFTLDTPLPAGTGYDLRIINDTLAQFATQCDVVNGQGTMPASNVDRVLVRCTHVRSLRLLAGQIPLGTGSRDGFARDAKFNNPQGVAVDSAGHVYVADTNSHTIRRITPEGVVSTFAGSAGQLAFADGTGLEARFLNPESLAIDGAGNLYVNDANSAAIRRVTATGVVTSFGGHPAEMLVNHQGVAADASGNVYVSHLGSIVQFSSTGALIGSSNPGDGTFGSGNITVDIAGNLYIADKFYRVIRRITPAGVASILAGSLGEPGSTDGRGTGARFNQPDGIAVDSKGTVFVTDSADNTVRSITADGDVRTLAGSPGQSGYKDGTGTDARFARPKGVAIDAKGDLYVADSQNNLIRHLTQDGTVTTFAGSVGLTGSVNGVGANASFGVLRGIAADTANNVYVLDGASVRRITSDGRVTTLAGVPDQTGAVDGAGDVALFNLPTGIAVDFGGTVYVADTGNNTIRRIAPDGLVTTLAGTAGSPGSDDGIGAVARFNCPIGIAADAAGNVYVADSGNSSIRKITPVGVVTTLEGIWGPGGCLDTSGADPFGGYVGIAVDASGSVYTSEDSIHFVSRDSRPVAGYPGEPGYTDGLEDSSRLNRPRGIATDSAGEILVMDSGNAALRVTSPPFESPGWRTKTLVSNSTSSPEVRLGPLPQPFGNPQFLAVTQRRIYLTSGTAVLFIER
jgi:sugar lactone lactonase YvrE